MDTALLFWRECGLYYQTKILIEIKIIAVCISGIWMHFITTMCLSKTETALVYTFQVPTSIARI